MKLVLSRKISSIFNKALKFIIIIIITSQLSGCLFVAIGAGIAGGIYLQRHYRVKVKVKKKPGQSRSENKKSSTSKTKTIDVTT